MKKCDKEHCYIEQNLNTETHLEQIHGVNFQSIIEIFDNYIEYSRLFEKEGLTPKLKETWELPFLLRKGFKKRIRPNLSLHFDRRIVKLEVNKLMDVV